MLARFGSPVVRLRRTRSNAKAGIKDPHREITIAQVHNCFTSTGMITMEDLRLIPRGMA